MFEKLPFDFVQTNIMFGKYSESRVRRIYNMARGSFTVSVSILRCFSSAQYVSAFGENDVCVYIVNVYE